MSRIAARIAASGILATVCTLVPVAANAATPTTVVPAVVCTDSVSPAAQSAVVSPLESSPTYYHTSQVDAYIGDQSTRVYGAGGGTLSISKGKSVTATASITGTTSADAGIIFAQVSVSVSVSVGMSKSWTTTQSYSYPVPSSETTGWIEAGVHAYKISYDKGHYISPCTWVSVQKNTIYGPTGNSYYMNNDKYPSTPHP